MMKKTMKVLTGVLASVSILFGIAAQPVQAMDGFTLGVDANGQAVVYDPSGKAYTSSAYLEHLVTNFTATPGDGCVTLNWAYTGVKLSDGCVDVYATTEDVTKMDPDDVLLGMPEKLPVDEDGYLTVMNVSQGPLCTSYTYTGLTNGVTYYFVMLTDIDGSNTVYTASAVPGTPVQQPAAQEVQPAVQEPAQQPAQEVQPAVQQPAQEVQPAAESVDAIAEQVLHGKWGNGAERRAKLEAAGYNYAEVQKIVNEKVAARGTVSQETASQETAASDSADAIAAEVIRGKWGNGAERREKLEAAGYNYSEVQNKVNELMR